MATLTDLATRSLQELEIIASGETPAAADLTLAVQALVDLCVLLPEVGAGRDMLDVETSSSRQAHEDERIICTVAGLTITTPMDPSDGARFSVIPVAGGTITVTPYRRKIEGGSSDVSVTDATTWAYRADLADWVEVTALDGTDNSPWPDWCDQPLVHLGAEELAAAFSVDIKPALGVKIARSRMTLKTRYARPRERQWGDVMPFSIKGQGRFRRYR